MLVDESGYKKFRKNDSEVYNREDEDSRIAFERSEFQDRIVFAKNSK